MGEFWPQSGPIFSRAGTIGQGGDSLPGVEIISRASSLGQPCSAFHSERAG